MAATHGCSWRVVAVAAALIAGCAADAPSMISAEDLDRARARWEEQGPARYAFELDQRCGERALIGRFRVTAEDGEVADVEELDEEAEGLVEGGFIEEVPTIHDLFDLLEAAREDAHEVEADFDDALGHPTRIDIDWEPQQSEDALSCYEILQLEPLPAASG